MDPTPDELAGIADLFDGLTRAELREAVENVAARQGVAFDPAGLDERIETARREYCLLALEHESMTVFVPGPAALPSLPNHAEDLPHMMDAPERTIDSGRPVSAARDRLRTDAERAVSEGDNERVAFLLEVCYDVEAWGRADVDSVRERLLENRP